MVYVHFQGLMSHHNHNNKKLRKTPKNNAHLKPHIAKKNMLNWSTGFTLPAHKDISL